eukprot:509909_1
MNVRQISFQSEPQPDRKPNSTLKKIATKWSKTFYQHGWSIEYVLDLENMHNLTFIKNQNLDNKYSQQQETFQKQTQFVIVKQAAKKVFDSDVIANLIYNTIKNEQYEDRNDILDDLNADQDSVIISIISQLIQTNEEIEVEWETKDKELLVHMLTKIFMYNTTDLNQFQKGKMSTLLIQSDKISKKDSFIMTVLSVVQKLNKTLRKPINIDNTLQLFSQESDLNEIAISNISIDAFCTKAEKYNIKRFQSVKLLKQIQSKYRYKLHTDDKNELEILLSLSDRKQENDSNLSEEKSQNDSNVRTDIKYVKPTLRPITYDLPHESRYKAPALPFANHPFPSLINLSNKFRQNGPNRIMYPPKNGPIAMIKKYGGNPLTDLPAYDPFDELTFHTEQIIKQKYEYELSILQQMEFRNELQNIRALNRNGSIKSAKKEISLVHNHKYPNVYIGDIVVRGPDWKWGDQNGGLGLKGTVRSIRQWHPLDPINVVTEVVVLWDHSLYGNYRFNYRGAYDVRVIGRLHVQSNKMEQLLVGDTVCRKQVNWRWDDQDGGIINNNQSYNGTIIELYQSPAPFEGARIAVCWD